MNKTEIIYFLPAVAGGSLKDLQANLDRFIHSNQFKSLVYAITLKAIILIIILMLIITIIGQTTISRAISRRKFCLARDPTTGVSLLQKALLLDHMAIVRFVST